MLLDCKLNKDLFPKPEVDIKGLDLLNFQFLYMSQASRGELLITAEYFDIVLSASVFGLI